jgi:hypothetical protein
MLLVSARIGTRRALGIQLHLKDPNAVMNAFLKQSHTEPDLTNSDKKAICSLYKNHPVSTSAVMKFIGQVAVCQKLGETGGPTEQNDQLSSASALSASVGHP